MAADLVPGTSVPRRELEYAEQVFPELDRELIIGALDSAYSGLYTREEAWATLRDRDSRRGLQISTQVTRLGFGPEIRGVPEGGETPREAFFRRMENELPLRGMTMRAEMQEAWTLAERNLERGAGARGAGAAEMTVAREAERIFRDLFLGPRAIRFDPALNPTVPFPYLREAETLEPSSRGVVAYRREAETAEPSFRGVIAGRWYTREVFGVKSASSAVRDPGLAAKVPGATDAGTFRILPQRGPLSLVPFENYKKSSVYIDLEDARGRRSRQVVREVRDRPPKGLTRAWERYRRRIEVESIDDPFAERDEAEAEMHLRDVYLRLDGQTMVAKADATRRNDPLYLDYEFEPCPKPIYLMLDLDFLAQFVHNYNAFLGLLRDVHYPFVVEFAISRLSGTFIQPTVAGYRDAVRERKRCAMLQVWKERYGMDFSEHSPLAKTRDAETGGALTVLGWGYLEPLDELGRVQREAYLHRYHRLPAVYLNMERGYMHAVFAALFIHLRLPDAVLSGYGPEGAPAGRVISPIGFPVGLSLNRYDWFEYLCTSWGQLQEQPPRWLQPRELAAHFMLIFERHEPSVSGNMRLDTYLGILRRLRAETYTTPEDLQHTPFGRPRMGRVDPDLLHFLTSLGNCRPAQITGQGGRTVVHEEVYSGASEEDPGPETSESDSERTQRRRREREERTDEGGEPSGRPRSASRDVSLARSVGFGAAAQSRMPRAAGFGSAVRRTQPLSRLERLRHLYGLRPRE